MSLYTNSIIPTTSSLPSLWTHQQNCFDAKRALNKCLINMWCGTGKTRIFTYSILKELYGLSVIVFPSLGLINQFNNDYIRNHEFIGYWTNHTVLSFCSETDVGNKKNTKEIKYTTSEKVLKSFLKKSQKKVITVTYQSLEKFVNIILESDLTIDYLVYDEAHRAVGHRIQETVFHNKEFNAVCGKIEFYTATPVNRNGIIMSMDEKSRVDLDTDTGFDSDLEIGDEEKDEEEEEVDLDLTNNLEDNNEDIDDDSDFDSDDLEDIVSHCGSLAFEYLYCDAVKDGISRKYEVTVNLAFEKKDVTKTKTIYENMIRTCLSTPTYNYWNILTFHGGVNESTERVNTFVKCFSSPENVNLFKTTFQETQNNEFPETKTMYSVRNICFEGIHSDMSTKKRNAILKKFDKKVPGRIFILSSCRTIGEGIDTKWANMEVPVDPTKSIVYESQKIGRITRMPEPDMPPSILLIPVSINKSMYERAETDIDKDKLIRKELNENRDFSTLLNVISAFKYQFDKETFDHCLRYPNKFSPDEVKKNLERQGFQIEKSKGTLIDNINYLVNDPEKVIEPTTSKNAIMDLNEISDQIERPIEIHSQNMDQPVETVGSQNEKSGDPIRLFQNENDEYQPIVEKDGNSGSSGSSSKKNPVHPPEKRDRPFKINYDPDLLVLWNIEETQFYDKFGKGILDCELSWNKKLEKRWFETLEEVKIFIDEERKLPSGTSKNVNERKMKIWLYSQTQNYKKNKWSMKNKKLKDEWENFIQDPKYKQYFLSNEKYWFKTLNQIKRFIDKEGRRPNSMNEENKYERVLGQWMVTQGQSYKKKIYIMKKKNIRKIWKNLTNNSKYALYFGGKKNIWFSNFKKAKKYLDQNKKRPNKRSEDPYIKFIGAWLANQQTSYQNKSGFMKNLELKKTWEKFIQDPSYSCYFCSEEEQWFLHFKKAQCFIIQNGKRPNKESDNIYEKKCGHWLGNQLYAYKNQTGLITGHNPTIKKAWEEFIQDPKYTQHFWSQKEKWFSNFKKTKQFLDEKKKRPNQKSEGEKKLGLWINGQIQRYKNQIGLMKYEKIKNVWKEFIQDPKYAKHFLSNEEKWMTMFKKVKEFIDKNDKRPRSSTYLGRWVGTQIQSYKKLQYIMKESDKIKNIWEEFIKDPKYAKYFCSKKEIWISNLELTKKYLNQKNEKPNRRSKNPHTKFIGGWLQSQIRHYKKRSGQMKNPEIKKTWEEFINNPKYSKFLNQQKTKKRKPPQSTTTDQPPINQPRNQETTKPIEPKKRIKLTISPKTKTPSPKSVKIKIPKKPTKRKRPPSKPIINVEDRKKELMATMTHEELAEKRAKEECQRSSGYQAPNPEAKNKINEWISSSILLDSEGDIIVLDGPQFKSSAAIVGKGISVGRIIVPNNSSDAEEMTQHPIYGGCVIDTYLEDLLDEYIQNQKPIAGIYADFMGQEDIFDQLKQLNLEKGCVIGYTRSARGSKASHVNSFSNGLMRKMYETFRTAKNIIPDEYNGVIVYGEHVRMATCVFQLALK